MRTVWNFYRVWLAICAGYLIGSILTADIAARLSARRSGRHVDLRTVGSGNPGGANALSNLGTKWGIAVIFGDIAKGALAALAGLWIARSPGAYAASAAAVIGHCFPAWASFKGGKGIGTSVGTTLVTFPAWMVVDIGLMTTTYKFSKHAAAATYITGVAWVLGSTLWWRKGWSNLWGTSPTIGLPIYATITTAVVFYKFLTEPQHMGDRQPGNDEE